MKDWGQRRNDKYGAKKQKRTVKYTFIALFFLSFKKQTAIRRQTTLPRLGKQTRNGDVRTLGHINECLKRKEKKNQQQYIHCV